MTTGGYVVRLIGTHEGCGGAVSYHSTPSRGWRTCDRCGQSGLRAPEAAPETTHEAKR